MILFKVSSGLAAFPDFTNPDAVEWWTNLATDFHEIIPFDGMWIVRIILNIILSSSYCFYSRI
jgi:hypothetical protein